jgi:hypothetical protein
VDYLAIGSIAIAHFTQSMVVNVEGVADEVVRWKINVPSVGKLTIGRYELL